MGNSYSEPVRVNHSSVLPRNSRHLETDRHRNEPSSSSLTPVDKPASSSSRATSGSTRKDTGADDVPRISRSEVAKHCTQEDAWMIIDGRVYDVTKFAAKHPGGAYEILRLAGKDGTAAFRAAHADVNHKSMLARQYKGQAQVESRQRSG